MDGRQQLASLVREQASNNEVWQDAELHLLQQALVERLEAVGVGVTTDVAVALMATATLLGQHLPEWGGDARCSLAEVALLGLQLLDRQASSA